MDHVALLLQLVINGVLMGGVYSLIAVGLTLIYGLMRIINFAHGDFLMLSMYATFWLHALLNLDPLVSVLLVFPTFFGLGYFAQTSLIRPVLKAPTITQALITLGLSLVMQTSAQTLWTADYRRVSVHYGAEIAQLGILRIEIAKLIMFVVSLTLCLGLYLFLKRTFVGTAMRAVAQDRETAQTLGVDADRIYAITFGIGIGLVAVAGALMSILFYVYPYVGTTFVLIAFVVVALGGLGNYVGTLLSGFIVGVVESISGYYLLSSLRYVPILVTFILILLLRPEGIFEKRLRRTI